MYYYSTPPQYEYAKHVRTMVIVYQAGSIITVCMHVVYYNAQHGCFDFAFVLSCNPILLECL